MTAKVNNVKKMLNGKKTLIVKGRRFYWNYIYRVYNAEDNNEQLTWAMVEEAIR